MAVDKVIVQYEADITKLKQDLNAVEKGMSKVEKSAVKSSKAIETAAEKRAFLIDKEIKRLETLKKRRDDAFSPRRIRVFNQQIKNSEENIKLLRGQFDKTTKQGGLLGNQFKRIGLLAAGAFAVDRVIAFGKASIKAFDEQEKAEQRLEVALGNRFDIQERLLVQAKDLQGKTVFGDQDVISAQALIAAFTQEEEVIKELTRVTLDFATAKGFQLPAAAELVSKTFASSTNSLTRYGIQVEGAAGSTERLESITTNLDKAFKGQAEAATTGAGKLQQFGNRVGDLNERIGGLLTHAILPLVDIIGSFVNAGIGLIDTLSGSNKELEEMDDLLGKIGDKLSPEALTDNLEDFVKIQERRNELLARGVLLTLEEEEKIVALVAAEREQIKEERELEQIQRESVRNVFLLTEKIKELTEERKSEGVTLARTRQINRELNALQEELNNLLGKQKKEVGDTDKEWKKLSQTLDKDFRNAVRDASKDISAFIKLTQDEVQAAGQFFDTEVGLIIDNNVKIAQLQGDRVAEEEALFQQRLNNLQTNFDEEGNITQASMEARELLIKEHEQNITAIELDEIQKREDAKISIIKSAGTITLNLARTIGGEKAAGSKQLALFEIAANEAVAISELIKDVQKLGVTPVEKVALFLAGFAQITSGILQAKNILSSEPVPAFAEGVVGFKGKGTSKSDSNVVRISNKESIITAAATERYRGVLEAANDMRLENYLAVNPISQQPQGQSYDDYRVWKAVKNNKTVNIGNMNDFASKMSEYAYLNKRYPNAI